MTTVQAVDRPRRAQERAPSRSRTMDTYTPPQAIVGPGGITNEGREPTPEERVPMGPGGIVGREPTRVNGAPLPSASAGYPSLPVGEREARSDLRSVPFWHPRVEGADPESAIPIGPGGIERTDLVELSSRTTGVPTTYARALFAQEGGDNTEAANPRSTARGLTQFIEGTWLQMMREYGPRYGLPQSLANQIEQKPNGAWRARTREAHDQLMELRFSPEWNAVMSGHYANQEHGDMVRRAGRPVSIEETYLAHFMNGDVAGQWVRAVGNQPQTNARAFLRRIYANNPRQADAIIEQNPNVFSESATVRSVYERQTRDFRENGLRRIIEQEEASRGSAYSAAEREARRRQLTQEFRSMWGGSANRGR